MTVHKGSAGGTIHYKPANGKGKTACRMPSDSRMSWTDKRNESSCAQCLRDSSK